jgi:hypothetical protein
LTRFTTATGLVGFAILLAVVGRFAAGEPQQKPNDEATELKALQNERIEVLTQLVVSAHGMYAAGIGRFGEVLAAHNLLIAAQLDSTDDPEKRVALLTQQLKVVSALVEENQERVAAGMAMPMDVYQAKSLYLDVKIKLLRERSSHKPSTPGPLEKNSK